jgi:hypothetical protein
MWVAPDSRSPDEHVRDARVAAAPPEPDRDHAGDRRTPPLPVPLRPLTPFDVVDGAIGVLKSAPATVLAIAAVFVVPVELLVAWFDNGASGRAGVAGSFRLIAAEIDDAGGARGTDAWLLLALVSLSLMFLAGAIGFLVASWYGGRSPSIADSVGASLRHGPALLVAWCAVHAIEVVATLAGAAPGVLMMVLFLVTAPAIVVEDLGPFAGMRRSWRLTSSRYGASFGVALLIALVDGVLTVALSPVGALLDSVGAGLVADMLCTAAASMVTLGFVASATTLVYLDRRVRAEGLDLELGISEHLDAT